MPLREYQCDACGHRFEVIQKMSDPALDVCPKCGGVLRKLQAAPAFHLKGTGWYVTDYAKKDQSSAKAEDESKGNATKGAADKDKGDKGESKTDGAKSETKTDAAKSSDSSAAASPGASSTPSPAPAKAPAKDS